jgi:hypothetical protein
MQTQTQAQCNDHTAHVQHTQRTAHAQHTHSTHSNAQASAARLQRRQRRGRDEQRLVNAGVACSRRAPRGHQECNAGQRQQGEQDAPLEAHRWRAFDWSAHPRQQSNGTKTLSSARGRRAATMLTKVRARARRRGAAGASQLRERATRLWG